MLKHDYSHSSLAKKAEKLLSNNSLFSNDDQSPSKDRSGSRRMKPRHTFSESEEEADKEPKKRLSKKPKKIKKSHKAERVTTNRSTPRSKKQSNGVKPPEHVSRMKDNYTLRIKLQDLKKTLQSKEKKIDKLYKDIHDEREEIRTLAVQANDAKKKEFIVNDLTRKIQHLQENEMHLMRELSEQQKATNETLHKLHVFQEESAREIERTQRQYESRIEELKLEKENLLNIIKDFENAKAMEQANRSLAVSNEIMNLNSQLNMKATENERLKAEIIDLRRALKEQEEASYFEAKNLKNTINQLSDDNRILRKEEEEHTHRESQERARLKREIEDLEVQMRRKEDEWRDKERNYREQIEKANDKAQSTQRELRRISEYEFRIEQLLKELEVKENEVHLAKKYYKEKLAIKKQLQLEQKQEWTKIYGELLEEIRALKVEIDNLEVENKRLVHSGSAHRYRGVYHDH